MVDDVSTPLDLKQLVTIVETNAEKAAPLDQLTEAVRTADGLTLLADELIGHFVDQARNSGSSWAEIGGALGVTRQAAQKRFVSRRVPRERKGLFARFSDEARSVPIEAQEQARGLGHDFIGTGHIVLALIQDPKGRPATAIGALDVSPEQVRESMLGILGPSRDRVPDHIPFAADAKKALELSLREAIRTRSKVIRPEHILLGVLRDQKSPAAFSLSILGIDHDAIEDVIGDT